MEPAEHLKQQREDHELLIRIDEKLKTVIGDIKDVKDNLSARVTMLEETKLSKDEARELLKDSEKTHDDHLARIEQLENWRWLTAGGLTIVLVIVIPLVVYIFSTQSQVASQVRDGVISALSDYQVTVK